MFCPEDIREMISELEVLERHLDVTGVLVYDQKGFLVVLEGEVGAVTAVIMGLQNDTRYQNIEPVMIKADDQRIYKGWHCNYCNTAYRPPLRDEIGALRDRIEQGEIVRLQDTRVLDYISSYEQGRSMMQIRRP